MPSLIDYTVDVAGSDLVATFGANQDGLSGHTIYLRLSADRKSASCGGTVPVKYLPTLCREGGTLSTPRADGSDCPHPEASLAQEQRATDRDVRRCGPTHSSPATKS
jgi:hypothetical protein